AQREPAEHQRDADQLARVDERVVAGARKAGCEGDDEGAAADPEVRPNALAAEDRERRAADEDERPERVERDRPEEGVAADRAVGRRSRTGGGGDRGSVHRGEEDRRDRRRRRDRERAEEDVPGARPQLEPCRARAEVGDGEYAAAEVVGAEEPRRPACSLRGRLARRRGGAPREAEGPA